MSKYAEAIGLPLSMCREALFLDGERVAVCTRPAGNHRKHWMDAPMFPRITWDKSGLLTKKAVPS